LRATDRVVSIVSYIVSGEGPSGVTEISKKLGLSKSSAYRALSSLKNARWVTQDSDTKKYSLGSTLLEVGLSVTSRLDLRSASLPFLNKLGMGVLRKSKTKHIRFRQTLEKNDTITKLKP
jgi:DNA-binding IclR family transcriptional regulator